MTFGPDPVRVNVFVTVFRRSRGRGVLIERPRRPVRVNSGVESLESSPPVLTKMADKYFPRKGDGRRFKNSYNTQSNKVFFSNTHLHAS